MFTVYMHVNKTNQKKYIGITSQKPEDRWGPNGNKYTAQYFSRAIEKYGWDNFDHYILCEDLAENEAKQLEVTLIEEHNTFNPEFGYNCTLGGDGCRKYKSDEDFRITRLAKQREARLNIKENDPEKYQQRLEQMREFKKKYKEDPVMHEKLLEANRRCHAINRATPEGRAKDRAATLKTKAEAKQIRNELRDLYQQHPDLFSDEDFEIVFARRQTPNKSWVFTYNSKKALSKVLMKIKENLNSETDN
jgi:hypothetical protein